MAGNSVIQVYPANALTSISATGASGAAVTLTIPSAGAGLFNYVVGYSIEQYAVAALTGGATPVVVTTTGILGTPSYTFSTGLAIGTMERVNVFLSAPIKGTAAATAATIVAPLTTNVIWRLNAYYYTDI